MLKAIHAKGKHGSGGKEEGADSMLVAARLRHIAGSTWSERKYLNMHLLGEWEKEDQAS